MNHFSRTTAAILCLGVLLLLAPGLTFAQDAAEMSRHIDALEKQLQELKEQMAAMKPAPAAPPAGASAVVATTGTTAPEKTSIASLLGPTSISGFVDVYYGQNFNNPASRTTGLRAFDANSNQFGLNLTEVIVDKAPDAAGSRTGYHLAFGFGQAINAVNASDAGGLGFDQYLKEAYFSYLAPVGKGLQIDVGKFVTPAGFEVIETKDNWNYSRGILFGYAIPYYHFGARAKYTASDKFSITGFLMNGWNNVVDNNTGKTGGISVTVNPSKKVSITQNYIVGAEGANNNSDKRHLLDTVLTISPTSKLSLAANYDYGRGDRIAGIANPVYWTGIAGYLKYAFDDKYAFSTRYEYYNDHYGFTTGVPGHIQEFTGTFQRMIGGHIMSRLEYRHDEANNPFFTKGSSKLVTGQDTLSLGMIFMFDSREAK